MDDIGLLDQEMEELDADPDFVFEWMVLGVTERICELMKQKGITRTQLADRLDTSRANVTKLLSGDQNLQLKTLVRMAGALGEGFDVFIPASVREGEAREDEKREQSRRRVGALEVAALSDKHASPGWGPGRSYTTVDNLKAASPPDTGEPSIDAGDLTDETTGQVAA